MGETGEMKVAVLTHCVTAETRAEAEDKRALIDTLPTDLDQLSLLSEALNLTLQVEAETSHCRMMKFRVCRVYRIRDRVLEASGKESYTQRVYEI